MTESLRGCVGLRSVLRLSQQQEEGRGNRYDATYNPYPGREGKGLNEDWLLTQIWICRTRQINHTIFFILHILKHPIYVLGTMFR
jgi:hypothetical protein